MRIAFASLAAVVGTLAIAASAHAVTIQEFSTANPNSQPAGITTGPDGRMWFTESLTPALGSIATNGTGIASTPVPGIANPLGIVTGPDGALWFSDEVAGRVGRMTTAGAFTEYTLPTGAGTQGIAAGPDGNMWFTSRNANLVGYVTPAGTVTEFPLPNSSSLPVDITAGPDGAMWFTEELGDRIGRITTAGVITEFPVPTPNSNPRGITAGPDGNVWFTERDGNKIGRVVPSTGAITEFPVPTGSALPYDITSGPGGLLWFTENNADAIGSVTPSGTIVEYQLPEPHGGSMAITAGPDGAVWYTRSSNRVGRLVPDSTPPPAVPPVAGQSVDSAVVSGRVLIRRRGTNRFVPLQGGLIPIGSEVDATNGVVRVNAAVGTGTGAIKTADFRAGRFIVRQPRARNAVLDAVMSGPLRGCRKRGKARRGARTSASRGRRLWGKGRGSFRTTGRRGAATVRGTEWLVEDRCDGSTRFSVKEGVVTVRDFARGRNITLRAGRSYVARPRRR